ncbi:MAG: TonB-dependent receptor, partial [Acidobacteriota bacterium]|nr:TonB-dependent receptor [Acidobacteriota bacterium]
MQNTQVVDQMSLQVGRHSFKFGGDYTRQTLHDVQFQQFGTYTFASNGAPISFQQQLGVADLRYGQTRFATFIQDDWRASSRLTLNLGLRYDYQSIIEDYNNFGPRFGFAYDFGGKGDTVIRGGAGVYYDQPFLHGFTQRYLLNAPNGLTRQIRIVPNDPSGVPFPTFLFSFDPRTPFNSFSPAIQSLRRNLFVRGEEIRNPYTVQFSIGVQRKLFGDW